LTPVKPASYAVLNSSQAKGRHTVSTTVTEQAPTAGALASQALFESLFDHTPMIDVRTPADVRAQYPRPAKRS